MFKFTIIDPQQNSSRKQIVDFMTKKTQSLKGNNFFLKDPGNIIFIIVEEIEKKIIGGACVFKNELKNIQEDVRELIATLTLHKGYVWECTNVSLEMPIQNSAVNPFGSSDTLQNFYRELYKGFVKFGKKKSIGFVIMKLTADVYVATKEFGLWPYVVELKPENSPDGLFHGILPLIGRQYEAYQNIWENPAK